MSTSLFSNTPMVTVLDNRGLTVRSIAYHCHPGSPDVTDVRVTRHQFDTRGALTRSADPRLHDAGLANFTSLTGLSGAVLHTVSADAGTTLALNDTAGRPFMVVNNIRTANDSTEDKSHAVTRSWQYEGTALPGRPVSITEQLTGEAAHIKERFVYAGNTDAEKALNLAGQCISHYDTAGRVQTDSISLTGVPLFVTRCLLKNADNPDTVTDWQGEDASVWNDLLGGEAYTTQSTADATGTVLTTTDAKGNEQRVAYDVAGMLSGSWLRLNGGREQVIVKSLTYSAAGQKQREEHGNGVVTSYTYEAQTQRLIGIKTERPTGHASGAKVLQDLRYDYDPVGNVLSVKNDAEETRFWRNQKVVPENIYAYDSLYQLVSATGREMANAGQQGSRLSAVPPFDNVTYTHYNRSYIYDRADNLTQILHSAPATHNNYTTDITVSNCSNRGVLSTLTASPAEVDALFMAGGQQKQLQPGQSLRWTPRNELLQVTPVVRDGDANDGESYRYDGGSQRILKVSQQKTNNSTQTQRVLYLAGLELRTTTNGSTETENLQVITAGEAGCAQVRVLHWESGKPAEIRNDPIRWSYNNLIGSSGLELDAEGNIISLEEYYPYGGTAVLTARSQREADYKTVRYSGKERDATGLYYYGYRYYQPWAGRWLSADPAGTVDGLNLFRMVRNNPVTLVDTDGRISMPAESLVADVLSPMAKNPSNTWFEELKWSHQDNQLKATAEVYTTGMNISNGNHSQWSNTSMGDVAYTIFLDGPDETPRLFVNHYGQHIGMKPGMGNPVYAGLINVEKDEGGNFLYHVNNNSGHYQPPGDIDVESFLKKIIPEEGMSHFEFTKVNKIAAPDNTRLTNISSPEDYASLVESFKIDRNKQKKLINYLTENNLWEPLKQRHSSNGDNMPWVGELIKSEGPHDVISDSTLGGGQEVITPTRARSASPMPKPGLWQRFTNWISNTYRKLFSSRKNVTSSTSAA